MPWSSFHTTPYISIMMMSASCHLSVLLHLIIWCWYFISVTTPLLSHISFYPFYYYPTHYSVGTSRYICTQITWLGIYRHVMGIVKCCDAMSTKITFHINFFFFFLCSAIRNPPVLRAEDFGRPHLLTFHINPENDICSLHWNENVAILMKFSSLAHKKLSLWQLSVQPVMKISSKRQHFQSYHFHFSVAHVCWEYTGHPKK